MFFSGVVMADILSEGPRLTQEATDAKPAQSAQSKVTKVTYFPITGIVITGFFKTDPGRSLSQSARVGQVQAGFTAARK
jgi:hypothetical protein